MWLHIAQRNYNRDVLLSLQTRFMQAMQKAKRDRLAVYTTQRADLVELPIALRTTMQADGHIPPGGIEVGIKNGRTHKRSATSRTVGLEYTTAIRPALQVALLLSLYWNSPLTCCCCRHQHLVRRMLQVCRFLEYSRTRLLYMCSSAIARL